MVLDLGWGIFHACPTQSRARSAPRTSAAKKGRPAWRPTEPAKPAPATWARAGKSRLRSTFSRRQHVHPGGDHRYGRHPADLADPSPAVVAHAGAAHLLGRRRDPFSGNAGGRFLLQRLVRKGALHLAGGVFQPGRRLQRLLGDAIPQVGQASRSRTSAPSPSRSISR